MRQEDDYRRDRHVVSALNVHLVFVAKYWRGVLTGEHLHALWSVFTSVCADFDAELVEMGGQDNHTCRRAAREPAEGRLRPPAAAALPGANPPVHFVVPVVLRRVGRWRPMGDAQGVQRQRRAPDPAGPTPPLNGGAYARRSTVIGLPGERLDAVGVALALASACWYTCYILVGEYLLRGIDPLAASAYVSSGAACSFLAWAAVGGGPLPKGATPSAYAAAAAMAVVGTALAIAAFLAGMARVGSAWASIASPFEPVFTVALVVAVLGDRLSPGKVAGGLAVVAGAVLLPLLGGTREAVGSRLQPEYTPTRGSTRR